MACSDAALVEAALDGEPKAFEEIVRRYQRLVFNIVYHYLGRRNEVEDIAQEVFLKLYRSLERFDTSRPLKAWIGRIASNACLDELRRARTRYESSFADHSRDEEERIRRVYDNSRGGDGLGRSESEQSMRLLQEALEGLGEKDRMAFVMRELEELEYAEVAEMMGTSQVAARIRVSRARKKLIQRFKALMSQEGALSAQAVAPRGT